VIRTNHLPFFFSRLSIECYLGKLLEEYKGKSSCSFYVWTTISSQRGGQMPPLWLDILGQLPGDGTIPIRRHTITFRNGSRSRWTTNNIPPPTFRTHLACTCCGTEGHFCFMVHNKRYSYRSIITIVKKISRSLWIFHIFLRFYGG
jgi:hypothetical protein